MMADFLLHVQTLNEYESELDSQDPSTQDETTYGLFKSESQEMWDHIKEFFTATINQLQAGKDKKQKGELEEIADIRSRYKNAFAVFRRIMQKCEAAIKEVRAADSKAAEKDTAHSSFHVPPCDIEIFSGDYLKWPSFRDLFTAVYINNTRLSKVEKLFHLNAKTSGDAKEIVSKASLTHDGFDVAWSNLKQRFENKRILINSQLRILFNLPKVSTESGDAIKTLQNAINNSISALKIHEINISNWDCIFIYLCSTRLPELTLSLWEQSVRDKTEIPKWEDFDAFLIGRYRTLETISDFRSSESGSKNFTSATSHPRSVKSHQTNVTMPTCKLCPNQQHTIRNCPKFLQMNVEDRLDFIRRHGLCLNCFSRAHGVKNCNSSHNCYTCDQRHNTLLHINRGSNVSQSQFENSSGGNPNSRQTANSTASNSNYRGRNSQSGTNSRSGSQKNFNVQIQDEDQASISHNVQANFAAGSTGVLLGTAVVQIYHLGHFYPARALIDSGSEGTFISDRLFRLLELPSRSISAKISGLNNGVSASCTKVCSLVLSSRFNSGFRLQADAYVIPKVTGKLPSSSISAAHFANLPDVQLADSDFFTRSDIDLLIGSDLAPAIMLNGVRHNICGSLLGQETVFGWILSGPVVQISSFSTSIALGDEDTLDKSILRFWEVEELPKSPVQSEADKFCEQYFRQTTRRDSDGRYVVSLPFKDSFPHGSTLGNSRPSAYAQFLRNENRLLRISEVKGDYDKVLQEYLDLGHMHVIAPPRTELTTPLHYYLPHHAVIKPESTTTKLRVVFNASSPSSSGKSLNDVLHTGPVLQLDLTLLVLRWRFFQFVFNADIEKMYRQIRVAPSQQSFQRILFRESENGLVRDYELSTVTFGVNCAPYLAIRTLHQLADDVRNEFPLASDILRNYMYVDDVLAGAHEISRAEQACDEVISALTSAGFSLRKWTSNSKQILSRINPEHVLRSEFLEFEDSSNAKTLGIRWNAQTDDFYFSATSLESQCKVTKRVVLSQISKLFDPAGWLAPCIVSVKMLMQKLWLEKIDWDVELPVHLSQEWHNFLHDFPNIEKIRIPRWINYSPSCQIQFHIFCDASERAYAATIYTRISVDNVISCHLLTAKSRVAPVKTISLPRLELCGAVLAAEMSESIISKLEVSGSETFFWTDSTIVLAWLRKPPCTWSTFVANRVSTISAITVRSDWFHVDTHSNPADLATRGLLPSDLISNNLWWNGPVWLLQPQNQWPYSKCELPDTQLEQKTIRAHVVYFKKFEDILERFSDLARAFRVIAYIFRFFHSCRPHLLKISHDSTVVNRAEIHFVKERLILINQKVGYSDEYHALTKREKIATTSSLLAFNPFIDGHGIMRVSGRLTLAADMTYDEKHPIILPYDCQLSRLLIHFTHKISLHGGNQLVHRLIRLQFAIPRVKNLIKATIRKCKICVLYKQRVQEQLMGSLPAERISISRPFTTTGLDFAGPFDIKSFSGRGSRTSKGYVCVFVCFSTKAIHLEAVSDMTTESFMAAFNRFASRRGCPSQIISDNGRNFVGAAKAIAQDFLAVIKESTEKAFHTHNISWKFIPPGAPHMGGLWEAGVKSFKQHFRKVASDFKFTFEEFATLLSRIESCLNSRPISAMSEDPNDNLVLTPGHFLVGTPLLAPTEPEIESPPVSILNRWQRLKALHQQFCTRWKQEYLHELQKRNKWKLPSENLSEGMIVVVREENLPPNEWRLGRIENVVVGKDSLARVADVRTDRGIIRRPIVKLVVLPTN